MAMHNRAADDTISDKKAELLKFYEGFKEIINVSSLTPKQAYDSDIERAHNSIAEYDPKLDFHNQRKDNER